MSEYQYYEFQAIERPLTPEEQRAVSGLSSRVEPHPTRAVFVYNYSDFPGSAEKVLAQYYDALFYITNWGSVQLAFRFPKSLLDEAAITPYCVEDYVRYEAVGDYALLSFERHDDTADGWMEGEGMLAGLLPLREAILAGDYRALYLAWLLGVEEEALDDDDAEPPLPAGLGKLTGALQSFVDLFGVDAHLLAVAAEKSGAARNTAVSDLTRAIATLSTEEQGAWLLRLAQGEANLAQQFKRRLPLPRPESAQGDGRTVGDLREQAEVRRQAEAARRKAAAAAKHAQAMEALALQADDVWRWVTQLIEQKNARAYNEAVTQLGKLKQLAEYQGQTAVFQARVDGLAAQYARRPAFVERLQKVKLVGGG